MDTAALDQLWSQVAQLRPRLRAHTDWQTHTYRGKQWYLLHDAATDRHYHLSRSAYQWVSRFDGQTAVESALQDIQGLAPKRDEAIDLLLRLHAADLLTLDGPADPQRLLARWRKGRRHARLAPLVRPLALRLPLLDPSALLNRLAPLVKPMFTRGMFYLWLATVVAALLLAAQHATALTEHAQARFLDPLNLLLLWMAYPCVKILHELGHACAIRAWGGRVRELGVMLLVFVPVPYVEASAATAFAEKSRRIVVGAAGIFVESLLAALALFVWLNVQPGWLRDLAFNISVIGGVSSLLFNGNPLLRFDGYYILADAIEIPNLATRAKQYYGYLIKRYAFAMTDARSPVVADGETAWFVIFGAASTVYRVVISLVIAWYVAGKFFVIGTLLGLWVVISQWLLPTLKMLRFLCSAPELSGRRCRAMLVTSALISVVMALVLLIPLPSNTVAQGMLMLPETAIVRSGASGEIDQVLHDDGAPVKRGDVLLTLSDPDLATRYRVLAARAAELTARGERERFSDRVAAAIHRDQLDAVNEELTEIQRRLTALTIKSPADGELELADVHDLVGRYAQKGQVFGIVRGDSKAIARVVVPQHQAERVRKDTRGLTARYPGGGDLTARLITEVPSATHILPSAALGAPAGGHIAVDSRDAEGVTALEPVFQFDVQLDADVTALIPGVRVLVRFEHGTETLGERWYQSLRQLFLDRLHS